MKKNSFSKAIACFVFSSFMVANATPPSLPYHGSNTKSKMADKNMFWWPNQLNLDLLRQHDTKSNPMGNFNYRDAVKKLNLEAVESDIRKLMKNSEDWWPADYGHYGPLFIRMTWHQAGTYRVADGRGGASTGNQRFAPLNSWPDNASLDKARRLLWPIKEKYGNKISWADLLVVAGNVALKDMGGPTLGVALGREDIFHPEKDIYWGAEKEWLGDNRTGKTASGLENPLAAVQMGLIYVNPEGPSGNPDPVASAKDVRETFKRMGMNDEETFVLGVGGHFFGKMHGAGHAKYIGPEPESAAVEEMGLGWKSSYKSGKGVDTFTSGLEGPWTTTPTTWDMEYLELLYGHKWVLGESASGAYLWFPVNLDNSKLANEVDGSKKVTPVMNTVDMGFKLDPIYNKIGKRFLKHPEEFADAFARAWFKLLHRDMGPKTNYAAGNYVDKTFDWQEPVPSGKKLSQSELLNIKKAIQKTNLTIQEMVETAWASAATFRKSDNRGGANGARISLSPQKDWKVNKPKQLARILDKYKKIAIKTGVSLADIIIIGGAVGIESASSSNVDITTGRGDATQKMTNVESFGYLELRGDGFRNYLEKEFSVGLEEIMLDKAHLLGLTPSEMTVLVAGMRSLGISSTGEGVWNNKPKLDNSWLKTLLRMDVKWVKKGHNSFEALDIKSHKVVRTATRADLIFGSNSELRAIAEFYAQDDNNDKFVKDFIKAWNKVMNADRFDLK
ncbi:catalase/peroxidase HPI [Malaciobacter mytili]|uniref:catalase/peroxidase HPI n=1 Tax=Malaciobacter mytili TaxID=603050 RepID=UPI003A897A29